MSRYTSRWPHAASAPVHLVRGGRVFVAGLALALLLVGPAFGAERAPFDKAAEARPSATQQAAWASARETAARIAPAEMQALDEVHGVPSILRMQRPTPLPAALTAATPEVAARAHLEHFAAWYRLDTTDVRSAALEEVHDTGKGGIIVSFTQRIDGVDVVGEDVKLLLDRKLGLLAITGNITGRSAVATRGARAFTRTAPEALAAALADFDGKTVSPAAIRPGPAATRGYATWIPDGAAEARPVRTKRVWFHDENGLVPAYYLELAKRDEAYAYVVSAEDGSLLARHNQLFHDAYQYRVYADGTSEHAPLDGPQGTAMTPHPTGLPDRSMPAGWVPPTLVTLQNGSISTNDPWLSPGATVTSGNNVDAYLDLVAPDGFNAGDERATVTSPGIFDYAYDPTLAPRANVTQEMGAITNLFYVNNWLHDWFYDAGFNEAARNAQVSNYGRGGIEGDPLQAAIYPYTFNTELIEVPSDGQSPAMAAYYFQMPGGLKLTMSSPASLAAIQPADVASANAATLAGTYGVARPVSGAFSRSTSTAFGMSLGTKGVAVADLNVDGIPDLMSANYAGNNVSVRLGTGGGAFAASTNYAMGTGPSAVTTGDFNHDGKLDVLCANSTTNNFSIRLGTGTGTFGAKTDVPCNSGPGTAAVGRFNADAYDDIAIPGFNLSTVSVFLGNAAGGFSPRVDYATGLNPVWVSIGDVNGDGKADLVTLNQTGQSISVLLGNGSGGFGAKTDYPVGPFPQSAALADMNGDGKLDVLVANYSADSVGVLPGDGTGAFPTMTETAVAGGPGMITAYDMTGDGIPDAIVSCSSTNEVAVLANNGAGLLAPPVRFAVGASPFGVAVADVSGDGQPDVLSANYTANGVTLLKGVVTLNEPLCPPYTSALANRIAVVDANGTCGIAAQIVAAQAQGAKAVIVRSATSTATTPDLTGAGVTIPVFAVNLADGTAIETALKTGAGATATLAAAPALARDGALDKQIVAHEWGHYMTMRLIGNGYGLYNTQGWGMNEGWADFISLLTTVRAEDAAAASNPGWAGVWAASGYALHNSFAADDAYYFSLRRYPYSTDMTKNPLTLQHIQSTATLPPLVPHLPGSEAWAMNESHDVGEIWCAMLWECYAALLRDSGRLTFAQARDRMRQYLVASQKLTPTNPTFVSARDALLAAANAADPVDCRLFRAAFAKRGLGAGAVVPSAESTTLNGVTESYDPGRDFTIDAVVLSDSLHSCDHDVYLDSGEDGIVAVTISNKLYSQAMTNLSVAISSTNPALTFANGGTISIPAMAIGQTIRATCAVHCASVSQMQSFDVHVSVPDPVQASFAPKTFDATFKGNLDVGPSTVDSVEAPVPNWTFAQSALGVPWVQWHVVQNYADPSDHYFLLEDREFVNEQYLVSPPMHVGSGPFTFTFRHVYFFDAGLPSFDGGVVELSQDDGATWNDIGSTLTPGYNGTLQANTPNPLAGRPAFVDANPSIPNTDVVTAALGTTYAGKTVRIRFHFGGYYGSYGGVWVVDRISVTGATSPPFLTIVPDSPCIPAAVTDDLPATLAFAIAGANPVRGNAKFGFALPERTRVRIQIFDVSGRRVATLADGEYEAGRFLTTWHRGSGGAADGPGVYFARMEAGGRVFGQRVIVLNP